jgi:hypothetical protein
MLTASKPRARQLSRYVHIAVEDAKNVVRNMTDKILPKK